MTEGFSSGVARYTFGPARAVVELAEQAASTLLDREVDLHFGDLRSRFVLRALHLDPSPFGLAAGRLDRVTVALEDVRWEGGRVDRLELAAHEVRAAPGLLRAWLVTAPVEVEARVSQASLDQWLGLARVAFGLRVVDSELRISFAGAHRIGHAVVDAEVRGRELRLTSRTVAIAGRAVPGSRRLVPPALMPIPTLPRGLQLREVAAEGEELVVRGVIPELREPVSLGQVNETRRALTRLASAGIAEVVLPRLR